MEFHRPCVLDPDKHRREAFSCGDRGLDEWLRRYAGQNRRANTAATWVIADVDHRVVAYATLSMTGIDRSAAPRDLSKGAPTVIPALLIGRLAVDTSVAGQGLGTALVRHVLATSVELNLQAACRAVVVTALNERAYEWWLQLGFTPFTTDDPHKLDLYLLSKDIRTTLEAGGGPLL